MQDKGKLERKEEPTSRIGNCTRGRYTSYTSNNNGGKREERSWFKGTFYKYGEEGHRGFKCTNSRKKIGSSSKNTLACEEVDETPNQLEYGENPMLRRILWSEEIEGESILRRILCWQYG